MNGYETPHLKSHQSKTEGGGSFLHKHFPHTFEYKFPLNLTKVSLYVTEKYVHFYEQCSLSNILTRSVVLFLDCHSHLVKFDKFLVFTNWIFLKCMWEGRTPHVKYRLIT